MKTFVLFGIPILMSTLVFSCSWPEFALIRNLTGAPVIVKIHYRNIKPMHLQDRPCSQRLLEDLKIFSTDERPDYPLQGSKPVLDHNPDDRIITLTIPTDHSLLIDNKPPYEDPCIHIVERLEIQTFEGRISYTGLEVPKAFESMGDGSFTITLFRYGEDSSDTPRSCLY